MIDGRTKKKLIRLKTNHRGSVLYVTLTLQYQWWWYISRLEGFRFWKRAIRRNLSSRRQTRTRVLAAHEDFSPCWPQISGCGCYIDDIPGTHWTRISMAIQYGNRTCYWRYFGKSWLSESAVNVFNAAQGQNWVMATGDWNRSRQDGCGSYSRPEEAFKGIRNIIMEIIWKGWLGRINTKCQRCLISKEREKKYTIQH